VVLAVPKEIRENPPKSLMSLNLGPRVVVEDLVMLGNQACQGLEELPVYLACLDFLETMVIRYVFMSVSCPCPVLCTGISRAG
jgi:hypothetical protein